MSDNQIRMQVHLSDDTHKVLKLMSIKEDKSMKYLLEEAVEKFCIDRFKGKSIKEVVESLNPLFKEGETQND